MADYNLKTPERPVGLLQAVEKLMYWAQVSLPAVYGEELTYAKEQGKMAAKINEVIEQLNVNTQWTQYLLDEGVETETVNYINMLIENGTLESLINNNLLGDIQTNINNRQTSFENSISARQGSFEERIVTQLEGIVSGGPQGTAASIANIPANADKTRPYLITGGDLAGHWVYWNGTAWVDGGVYQATEIQDNAIKNRMLEENIQVVSTSDNIIPSNASIKNGYYDALGTWFDNNNFRTITIPVVANELVIIKNFNKALNTGLNSGYVIRHQNAAGTLRADNSSVALMNDPTITLNGATVIASANYADVAVIITVTVVQFDRITIYNKTNIGLYNNLIDTNKIDFNKITLEDLPLNKNYVTNDRFIGKGGFNTYNVDGTWIPGSYYPANYNNGVYSYGLYKINAGETIEFVKDTALTLFGMFFNTNLVYVAEMRSDGNYSYTALVDGYLLVQTSQSGAVKTSFKIIDNSKQGIIPSYLVENYDPTTYNTWKGRKWCAMGDSIIARNVWPPLVVSALSLNYENQGVGSSCLSGPSNPNLPRFWEDARLNPVLQSNADVITILGGANDLVQVGVIGTIDECDKSIATKDKTNFYGAYSYIIEKILMSLPRVELMLMTVYYMNDNGASGTNPGNLTYSDYAEATRQVAKYYSLPIIDFNYESGFNKLTMGAGAYKIYSDDKVHPNASGAIQLARVTLGKFKEMATAQ